MTGNHAENPTLDLPCRTVFAAGQRTVEVIGPLLEDEAAALHDGDVWERPRLTSMRTINCTHLIEAADRPVAANRQIRIDGGQSARGCAICARPMAERLFVMPALVNAHDHGRAVRTSSLGASGKPLETWLQYQALIPSVDPYLAAVVALSRSALGGVGVVMMHLTRPQGLTDLPTEAAAIARAARDVGVRVGFAVVDARPQSAGLRPFGADPGRACRRRAPADRGNIAARPLLQPKASIALVDDVAAAAAGPMFDVQFGPNGVQWCSDALLAAIAEASRAHRPPNPYASSGDALSARLGGRDASRRRGQAPRCARSVVAAPDAGALRLGASGRTRLLAERGVTIAVNTSSNLHLRSGIAPVARMIAARLPRRARHRRRRARRRRRCACANLRLWHLLHVGNGFGVDGEPGADCCGRPSPTAAFR